MKLSEAIQITTEDSDYEHHLLLIRAAKHYLETRRRLELLMSKYEACLKENEKDDLLAILAEMPKYGG